MNAPVLLIEDTLSLQMVYKRVLEKAGFLVESANTAAEGIAAFKATNHTVVLLDLLLPDKDGMTLMAELFEANENVKIIVITADGSINRAVEAMRVGAFDFLVKPFGDQRLLSAVRNAGLDSETVISDQLADSVVNNGYHGFIGSSPVMQEIYKKISNIARSMATVFITGESGTGKEVCAQAIHRVSNRAHGPFIALNCGAIPADLLESEVFGHLKGSFTGAIADKLGAAAAAHGGTLFLDEICEMDMALQTKLLRFLETSTIQPVGSIKPQKVDVRIICATNREPVTEVKEGRFREDLFYRLHVVPIHLPALNMRGSDVIEIADVWLRKFAKEEGRKFEGFSDQVKEMLIRHRWPGNVRQLLNTVRNVVVLNDSVLVEPFMLPPDFLTKHETHDTNVSSELINGQTMNTHIQALLGLTMADIEQQVIEATIARFNGSVPKAARALELSPSTIYRKREAWQEKPNDELN